MRGGLAARAARACGGLFARLRWRDRRGQGVGRPPSTAGCAGEAGPLSYASPSTAYRRLPPRRGVAQKQPLTNSKPYDAIVIGAGITGIIFLAYARKQGLRCLLVDKQDDVGGLWNRLPPWQDIQNRKEDFAINGVPLEGVRQPDVVEHVRTWVREHGLADSVKLRCEVTSVSWERGRWRVQTDGGSFQANHLVVASGTQNKPWVPPVERSRSEVVEMHSSRIRRPSDLAGRRVAVVGGGASAWDLLDLAIDHGARDIHWVYRNPRWFLPTTKRKQRVWPNLRDLAIIQSVTAAPGTVSAFLQGLLRQEYDHFGLGDIAPQDPFDIREHMLIPGRSLMVQNLERVSRHRSEIRRIEGRNLALADGEHLEADVLLWGTGYRMDMGYLGLPEYRQIGALEQLLPRLGSLVRSLDYPNLFFLGMAASKATGSTPFFAALEARSIVAHMLGKCEVPRRNIPHQVTHWHLFRHFARFDRANYPRLWWRVKYFLLACLYAAFPNRRVRV